MKTLHGPMSCGNVPGGSAQRVDPASKSKNRLNRQAIEIEGRWCLNTHQRPWRTSGTIISLFCAAIKPHFPNAVKGGTETSR
jgi:hypothetical protein